MKVDGYEIPPHWLASLQLSVEEKMLAAEAAMQRVQLLELSQHPNFEQAESETIRLHRFEGRIFGIWQALFVARKLNWKEYVFELDVTEAYGLRITPKPPPEAP